MKLSPAENKVIAAAGWMQSGLGFQCLERFAIAQIREAKFLVNSDIPTLPDDEIAVKLLIYQ